MLGELNKEMLQFPSLNAVSAEKLQPWWTGLTHDFSEYTGYELKKLKNHGFIEYV
jgi:hypothetical protein